MVKWKNPVSLREAGFKQPGFDADWLIVGVWDRASTRDAMLGKIQIKQLRDTFGSRRVGEFQYPGLFDYIHVIVAEAHDDILILIRQQGRDWENGGDIDSEEYCNLLAPLVEDYWRTMSIADRVALIIRTQADAFLLYADTPDSSVYSELMATVEAN